MNSGNGRKSILNSGFPSFIRALSAPRARGRRLFTASAFPTALLILASCAASLPDTESVPATGETCEDLYTALCSSDSAGNHKELRKQAARYLESCPDGPRTAEVRLMAGNAEVQLGFMSEARKTLVLLLDIGVQPEIRREALILMAEIDGSKGRYTEAADDLLFAMSLGLEGEQAEKARGKLAEIVPLIPAEGLKKLREEHPDVPGVDIVLRGCLSFAASLGDTAYARELMEHLAGLDSLKTVPDRVIDARLLEVPSEEKASPAKKAYRIGLLCPLSGRFAQLGEAFLRGASLSVKEARLRGIADVELVVGDTRANAITAINVTRAMIRDEGLTAIVGGVISSATIAAAYVVQNSKAVLFSPVATEAGIGEIGDRIFQAPSYAEAEICAIAEIACRVMGLERIAFMSVDEPRARWTEALFRSEIERRGGLLVVSDFYEQGSTDFNADIERLRSADPEALFIASDSEDLILILPQLSFYEFGVQLLGSSAWNSRNLLRMAGRDMSGAVFPEVPDSGLEEELYRAASALAGEEVTEINRFMIGGYIGVRRMLEALVKSRSEATELREELSRLFENRQHPYASAITSTGISFFTVNNERLVEFMTLKIAP